MGLGSFGGGLGAARFLVKAGARVTVTDLRQSEQLREGLAGLEGLDVRFVLGEHRFSDFENADIVIANPAVAPNNEYLLAARNKGALIRSEVGLFLERCSARVVAITGTQGKSSTASMLAQLLERSGFRVQLGGNIGGSLLNDLDSMRPDDICVLELSSYQLEALAGAARKKRAKLSGRVELVAITNILSDHLERHGTRAAYQRAKLHVLELLDEFGHAIVPPEVEAQIEDCTPKAALIRVGSLQDLHIESGDFYLGTTHLGAVSDFPLPGAFQLENALIALGAAERLGAAPERLRESLPVLKGLAHRLQDLGQIRGHRIWDNGVSTTPDSTASALRSMNASCVLLCGGRYKNSLPLDVMIEAAKGRVHCAVTFGVDAPILSHAFQSADIRCRVTATLAEAVDAAFAEASPEDALLFSPACASFDAYRNFRERALEFNKLLHTSY